MYFWYAVESWDTLAIFLIVVGLVVVGLELSDEKTHDLVALVGERVEEERLEERLRDRHLRHHHSRKFVFSI